MDTMLLSIREPSSHQAAIVASGEAGLGAYFSWWCLPGDIILLGLRHTFLPGLGMILPGKLADLGNAQSPQDELGTWVCVWMLHLHSAYQKQVCVWQTCSRNGMNCASTWPSRDTWGLGWVEELGKGVRKGLDAEKGEKGGTVVGTAVNPKCLHIHDT